MTPEEQLRHRNQLIIFTFLAAAYGITCTALLFFLPEVTKSLERFLITSVFIVGGLCGLYGWLLSLLLRIQQGPEKEKTQTRLKIVSWTGCGIVGALLVALFLSWIVGETVAPYQ